MNRTVMTIIVLAGLCTVPASSQEVMVAELSKEDSAKAADLYKRLKAAEQDWKAFKTSVQYEYGARLAKDLPPERLVTYQNTGKPEFHLPLEWSRGIAFSTDFRFAVPVPAR